MEIVFIEENLVLMKTADGRIWESIHIVQSMLADFSEKRASSVYSFFDQTTPHDIPENINLHSTAVKTSTLI
jgi:hypothetical protein